MLDIVSRAWPSAGANEDLKKRVDLHLGVLRWGSANCSAASTGLSCSRMRQKQPALQCGLHPKTLTAMTEI